MPDVLRFDPWRAWGSTMACLLALGGEAWAQASNANTPSSIYTCIDAQGRRLTSDRPIAACLDREQRELGPSGTVRRVIPPSQTPLERAELETKKRAEEEARVRQQEESRRNRALVMRYPNERAHDVVRQEALAQVDQVVATLKRRDDELLRQRQQIDVELEFYQGDPAKAPPSLRRRIADIEEQQAAQRRFYADQETERARIHQRFDEELQRLRQLWRADATNANPS